MYKTLLAYRYLTSRVIPFVAVAAVALCVALVIVVVSVMSGFLDMVANSGRSLVGDVVVSYPIRGIPQYERLVTRLRELPDVQAASPVVDSFGLLRMPYPDGEAKEVEQIQFWGIEPESFAAVTEYATNLYWQPPPDGTPESWPERDHRHRLFENEGVGPEGLATLQRRGETLSYTAPDGTVEPAMVLGIHVSRGNERNPTGGIDPVPTGYVEPEFWWMPQYRLEVTTIPMRSTVSPEPERVRLAVANEVRSGVYLIDDTRIFLPLDIGQRLTHLDRQEIYDDEGESTGLFDPARATMILVRAAEGVTPDELKPSIESAYMAFYQEMLSEQMAAGDRGVRDAVPPSYSAAGGAGGVAIQTWLEQQARFIAPIEKERDLMKTLFSLVYIVCAGLVLAIFWAIVYEKTRDIGILRSVGASRLGIAMIFLRYGLIIGVFGAVVGCGLGYLIVRNINAIHTALGEPPAVLGVAAWSLAAIAFVITIVRSWSGRLLPIVVGGGCVLILAVIAVTIHFMRSSGGFQIWDPAVYYFSTIPNQMDVNHALWTMGGAILFSVVGAFLPAAKAADTDPVQALRYE